jgi:hypothetical protein
MRKFIIATAHRAPCFLCSKALEVGDEVYWDPDAPATPRDVARAANGESHVVAHKLAHTKCDPRVDQRAFTERWLDGDRGITGA